MSAVATRIDKAAHWARDHLLGLMLATYALAAFVPGPALRLQQLSFGQVPWGPHPVKLSAPLVMLALLLLNAGVGVRPGELRTLAHRPRLVAAGLLANAALPVALTVVVALVGRLWHSADELGNLLVGLAILGSMPIAGSSTAWAQNADGDVSLSVGLVLASTLASPWLTPIALRAVASFASGDYAEDLNELSLGGTSGFVIVSVVAPTLAGIALRWMLGEAIVARIRPALKLLNVADLLLLNWVNAALALPRVVAEPDVDFLALIVVVTGTLCVLAFSAGAVLGTVLRAEPADRVSLIFGLGMNNNGTGLVLAATALGDHPHVLLPIIAYNLLQQLAAAIVNARTRDRASPAS